MTEIKSNSERETEMIGKQLAEKIIQLKKPLFIALYGEMGAGKTAFVRGFVSCISPESKVKSPTYTIVNEYTYGEIPVFHFDLYRLEGARDLEGMGFYEYTDRGICIAEWSERLGYDLPDGSVSVQIKKAGENERIICISDILL